MFSHDIINDERENFDIVLWFTLLDYIELKKFITRYEWMNGNFIFTWEGEKCTHTMCPSSPYISRALHGSKKKMKYVFVLYGDRHRTSNILFIDEGEYHLEDSVRDNNMYNYLKMPSCWKFYSSWERELSKNNVLCSIKLLGSSF